MSASLDKSVVSLCIPQMKPRPSVETNGEAVVYDMKLLEAIGTTFAVNESLHVTSESRVAIHFSCLS